MLFGLVTVAALALASPPAAPPKDWNDAQIPWRDYEAGLLEAKRLGKPVLLVFHADWCKGCEAYRQLFFDAKVVALSARFVMVRVNRDTAPELSAKFDLDGEYIPRTFFLSAKGVLDPEIRRLGQAQAYFYDTARTSALRSGMKWALKRLAPKP